MMDLTPTQDRLLEASLMHIAFDGWTRAALKRGAADAGLEPIDIDRCFPKGVRDAILHFNEWSNRQMLEAAERHDLASLSIRGRIALLVRLRLEALEPYRDAVQAALTWFAMPGHQPLGTRLLYRTCDSVWFAAGDRSTDINFYTKRTLLAPVLASTTLYWLSDTSPGYGDTWAFLDRGLNGVVAAGKQVGQLGQRAESLASMANPVRLFRMIRPERG